MIGAFGIHAWLLLTLRHNGKGLPAKRNLSVFLVAALFVAASVLRWHDTLQVGEVVFSCTVIFCILSMFSVRAATGYAIISVAVDILSILAVYVTGSAGVLDWVEHIAAIALFARLAKGSI